MEKEEDMGKLDGKTAFITGAARGQGRSHAIRLAEEGADVIAVDIAGQIETIAYPMSTMDDLRETARAVGALGRRISIHQADVRDRAALEDAFAKGVAELGPVDIVLANAGISPIGSPQPDPVQTFADVVAVNMTGVWNTIDVAAGQMIDRGAGGAIVLTSSTQGLTGTGSDGKAATVGYAAAKHGIVGLMRSCANWLAPHRIRVNSVHPTGVNTPMIMNDVIGQYVADNEAIASMLTNALPVDVIEPVDVSNAILYLVSDDARYVTGVTLPVDAGFLVK